MQKTQPWVTNPGLEDASKQTLFFVRVVSDCDNNELNLALHIG